MLETSTFRRVLLKTVLLIVMVLLYVPIVSIALTSFSEDIVWPFPFVFSTQGYSELASARAYHEALFNSCLVGLGSGFLSTLFASLAAFAVLRYPTRLRPLAIVVFLAPLFIAELLIGIATLAFNKQLLGLSGSLLGAVVGNAVHSFSFAFLIMLSQLLRHDWRLEEAAKVFGARPLRAFLEVSLPSIWPALMASFLTSFLLGFNNLDISFYNLGAIPVLPTLSWGSLRYGLKPELFSLATIVNGFILLTFVIVIVMIRKGLLKAKA